VGTNVTGAAAADSAVEASVPMADVSPPTDSRATAPSMPSLTGPMDVFHADEPTTLQPAKPIDEFTTLQPPKPTKEAAIAPPTPAPERTVPSHSDVVWIQTKLRDLGYFGGNTSHVWGAASRTALREFKKMNGLHEDDTWDNETEQRLLSKQNVAASNTFLGGWALDADECQHVGEAGAPLIIQSRGAEAFSGKCDFRSVRREAATSWRIQAACSSGGDSWNANISLKLVGPNLSWSSERGTETYVRCVK